jgi:hypothetical protein
MPFLALRVMEQLKHNTFNSIILLFYGCLVIVGLQHHELWGDELHSWNIAKGSESISALFQNTRYEGHPPFWYVCLFAITRFTHNLIALKILQAFFTIGTTAILVFKSPFSRLQKVLILCGYYFVFEYAVLSRNYMPAVFFASCIAVLDNKHTKIYYLLLFLLSNVHLIGLLLAISIHVAWCYEKIKSDRKSIISLLPGFLIFIPSFYFIFPPQDSQMNLDFWIERWKPQQLYFFVTVILKSLFPFPDSTNPHWWNTNILLDHDTIAFRIISFLVFIFLLTAIFFLLKKNRIALIILVVNLCLTGIVSLVFPLNTARYTGFIFIGYLIAIWFALNRGQSVNNSLVYLILMLQIPAACFAFTSDYRHEFSSAEKIKEVFKPEIIPAGSFVATDYWSLNNLSAYMDSAFYTVELHRKISFLIWNNEMKGAIHFDYGNGLQQLLEENKMQPFYFFSMKNPEQAAAWSNHLKFSLVFFSGLSIERSGEIYLYRIESVTK